MKVYVVTKALPMQEEVYVSAHLVIKDLFKKRNTHDATGFCGQICFDPEDEPSALSLWFDYQNKFGRTSSTPAVKLSKEMLKDIVKKLYDWNLFTMEDLTAEGGEDK